MHNRRCCGTSLRHRPWRSLTSATWPAAALAAWGQGRHPPPRLHSECRQSYCRTFAADIAIFETLDGVADSPARPARNNSIPRWVVRRGGALTPQDGGSAAPESASRSALPNPLTPPLGGRRSSEGEEGGATSAGRSGLAASSTDACRARHLTAAIAGARDWQELAGAPAASISKMNH